MLDISKELDRLIVLFPFDVKLLPKEITGETGRHIKREWNTILAENRHESYWIEILGSPLDHMDQDRNHGDRT